MPFGNSLYDLLKRRQGLEVGGAAGGAGLLGAGAGGDPGVDPSGGAGAAGGMDPRMLAAARQQGLLSFGASLLANSGPQPGPRIGTGAAIGQALQAGQGAYQGGIDNQLQQMLLMSKIQESKNGGRQTQDPALVAEYKFAQANGFTGSFQQYIDSKQSPQQPPSAIQEAQYFAKLTPVQQKQYLEVKRAAPTPFQQTDQGGATGAFDQRTGGFTAQVAPEQNQAAAAALKSAEAAGGVAGKVDAERAATFQQDIGVIDDEILRTQRLLTEFQQGKYQTGPILGPAATKFTTAGQDLSREQGKDVLKNISQATFGALSEGERQFLKGIGIDPIKNEESNIAYLNEKFTVLQKAKQRLLSRPPVDGRRQSGATGTFTPPNAGARPPLSSFKR